MHLPLTGCEGYRPVRTGRHTGTRGTGYHGALWVGWEQLVHFQNTCVQGEQLHALMAAGTMGQTSPMLGLWTKQDPEPRLLRRPHPRHPTGPGLELLSGPHCACWCGRTLPSSAGPLHLHKVPNSSSSGSGGPRGRAQGTGNMYVCDPETGRATRGPQDRHTEPLPLGGWGG